MMVTQNKLNVGDLITIGKAKKILLIVRSEHRISPACDGNYRVDEIDVIPFDAVRHGLQTRTDAAAKSFYFDGGSMIGKGVEIKKSDITVMGTSKVEVEVKVTYEITKVKMY